MKPQDEWPIIVDPDCKLRGEPMSYRQPPERGMLKPLLDIEHAVRWAVDEMSKNLGGRLANPDFPSRSPMFSMVALGGPVDNWSREPGYPMALGDPHPDAEVIDKAIDDLSRFGASPLPTPNPGLMIGSLPINLEAVLTHAAEQMPDLVRVNAKLGRRPTWGDRPHLQPVTGRGGHVKMVRDRVVVVQPRDRQGYRLPSYRVTVTEPVRAQKGGIYPRGSRPEMRWSCDPTEFAIERTLYLAWWTGLSILVTQLAGKLSSLEVLEPAAPRYPWAPGEGDNANSESPLWMSEPVEANPSNGKLRHRPKTGVPAKAKIGIATRAGQPLE